ncbi:MAG TPA: N-6 DNA methylase, partial [Pyrinomonadaceae bacterium]|nr:N-6 DNA methylase [Pyrinomonadaceae bacterium]
LNGIHFTASDELHTLGALYESMLREMRDAAGDSGEFYTPRAVVRFMVEVTDPRLGETVLDPAAGTGGFLVESYNHLAKQVKTVADRKLLQERSLFGCEPKSLPYLLCQMNLLLHGLDAPQIDPNNALRFKLSEIGEKERVDVILTNPPFGGEEEKGIQGNFPEDRQTAETALLFLQLIMRKLRRQPGASTRPARAAVVVPDGTLFNTGVAARIREELVKEFNLHTIIRLPEGVFAPYAKTIKTNILFFDRSGPTKEVWYFEHRIPEDRKTYSKTRPIEFVDFAPCLNWWRNRVPNDQAWCVSVEELTSKNLNLDLKHSSSFEQLSHQPTAIVVTRVAANLKRAQEIVRRVEGQLSSQLHFAGKPTPIGNFTTLVKRPWQSEPGAIVKSLGVKWWGKGAYVSEVKSAEELQASRFLVKAGDLIYNDMWARHGSVAIVSDELDGCVASAHFPTWEIDSDQVFRPYLSWCFRAPWFWAECEKRSQGSTGRNAIRKGLFRDICIPLPSVEKQREIAATIREQAEKVEEVLALHVNLGSELNALIPSILETFLSPTKHHQENGSHN